MTGQTAMISAFGVLLLVAVGIFIWVRRGKFGGWALGLSVALLLIAAAGLVFSALAGIYTDFLFFTEVGYRQVFWTRTVCEGHRLRGGICCGLRRDVGHHKTSSEALLQE